MDQVNQELFDFIENSPTAFHAAAHTAGLLRSEGYQSLNESEPWTLEAGGKYFVTRNGSSVIAFRIPSAAPVGFMMTAAHDDSPCYRIKGNPELCDGRFIRLSTEGYGGMIAPSWMDRPLSVAGRVTVRTAQGMAVRLVNVKECCALIPNVAIHMNRTINEGMNYNTAVDMVPLWDSCTAGDFRSQIAQAAGADEADLLSWDLSVYNPQKGVEWGEYISAPRLDDLQCVFSSVKAFLASGPSESVPVCCVFDNEEVGSQTKQGAASTFLYDVLTRICLSLGLDHTDYLRMVANSLLLSCDNAHALHPNHPEYADKNQTVTMNGGVVIKFNASQRYISDAVSSGLFRIICEKVGAPVQEYANRADIRGGYTLGCIVNTQISANSADIGLAQIAMHSAYETAGARDTEIMIRALTAFFSSAIRQGADGLYHFL